MPRPLKPIKTKWYTPPDTRASRLALTGKTDAEGADRDDASADASAAAVFVATGIF